MSTYVVGDIQGCLQPLKCLLKAVAFNPDGTSRTTGSSAACRASTTARSYPPLASITTR